jgi:hypothetical protein
LHHQGIGTILYGRAAPEALPGREALEAEQEGFQTSSFIAIRWFTVLYLPVLPLGTFRVVKPKELSKSLPITPWPGAAAATSPKPARISPAPWRWDLVVWHYLFAWGAVYVLFHLGEWLIPAPR